MQKIEENSSFYDIQFSKLFQRLQALEEIQSHPSVQPAISEKADEENWKELYYEENELKEKLENELDEISQKLEYAENKLNLTGDNNTEWAALKSKYDARLNDLHAKENDIDLLKRHLAAAEDREKELQQSVLSPVQVKVQFRRLQNEVIRMQSENEELKKQVVEIDKREKLVKANTARVNKLAGKFAFHEGRKEKMIANLAH